MSMHTFWPINSARSITEHGSVSQIDIVDCPRFIDRHDCIRSGIENRSHTFCAFPKVFIGTFLLGQIDEGDDDAHDLFGGISIRKNSSKKQR